MASSVDRLISHLDRVLRTTSGSVGHRQRKSPASEIKASSLSPQDQQESARLMRVNHCGEVCAQALYQGQALTAKSSQTTAILMQAAEEEMDHLAWCEQRIRELDSHVSYLNPLWYAASFTMGAVAGMLGDRINLGFVAATEQEVCRHLNDHLEKVSANDDKTIAVMRKMREDENGHAATALEQGGMQFPKPVKSMMHLVSKLMTRTTYWV